MDNSTAECPAVPAASTTTPADANTRGDAPPGRLLKYTAYLYKNPNLTESEFHAHWRHHHARFPLAAMQKHGVVRYTQYHTTAATRALLEPMVAARKAKGVDLVFDIQSYDAVVQIWFPDMATWQRVAAEPVFGQAIFEDESYLFDCSKSHCSMGWDEDVLLDGKILSGEQGRPEWKGLETCGCDCGRCEERCKRA